MAWLEELRAFIAEEFIKNGGSPVATQRAFRIRFALGRREAVPDKKTIYRWVSNFRQIGQTLEALKEAIRQEVAAITPEIVLKVMDNYREAISFINIQDRHLSDVLFITHRCKTAFCVLSRNRKMFSVSSLVLNLFASKIGEFLLPHPIATTLTGWTVRGLNPTRNKGHLPSPVRPDRLRRSSNRLFIRYWG